MDRTHFVYPFVDGHLSVFTLRCYGHLGTSFPVALLPHLLGIYLAMELLALHLTLHFLISFVVFSMYIRVCVDTRMPQHVCGGQKTSSRSKLFFHHLGLRDQIGLIKLGDKSLIFSPLSSY